MDTGYPRTDILYSSNNEEEMGRLKEKLGLPKDKKVIMYAPTWRVRDKFELMLDLEKMKEKFSDEYVLILRLHHFSAKGWKGVPADGFVYDLTDYESIEDLYIITDILITDYSSVMFDYAVLDRPMLSLHMIWMNIEISFVDLILISKKKHQDHYYIRLMRC